MQRDKKKEAQQRLLKLAWDMRQLFDDVQIAGLFVGTALAVLHHALGPEKTIEYVATLADEMIDGDDNAPFEEKNPPFMN